MNKYNLDMDKSITDEDAQYLLDLGLVRQSAPSVVLICNTSLSFTVVITP